MGYIIVIIMGMVLVTAFLVLGAKSRVPKSGRISSDGQAILREEPSADEPTPGRSITAKQDEVSRADKKTPPA